METPVIVERNVFSEATHEPRTIATDGEDHRVVKDGAQHVHLATLDRGGVGEDLEAGSGRTRHVIGKVELSARPCVVVPADHREDLARLGVHADEGGIVEVVVIPLLRDLFAHHLLRHVLEVQVEAGVHAIPLAVVIGIVDVVRGLGERLQDIVDEVRCLEFRDRR